MEKDPTAGVGLAVLIAVAAFIAFIVVSVNEKSHAINYDGAFQADNTYVKVVPIPHYEAWL